MEVGSFIELQLPKGREFYSKTENMARLNSGRSAIFHAVKTWGCNTVWLPYYECDTVRDFLKKKKVKIRYYRINSNFEPIDLEPDKNEAVLFTNYFGVMSKARMIGISEGYDNIIIDNCQAFFAEPIENAMNIYSARKFVGVPDGSYILGKDADRGIDEYPKSYSSDTSLFLLQRIEYGCEGKIYENRMINEQRIDNEDIMQMSDLTRYILDGTDYKYIQDKRRENFAFASELFASKNSLDPTHFYDDSCVPMIYPFVMEDDALLSRLIEAKHFQGHWWTYLLDEVPQDSFEYWLSRFIIPITIDQRYGKSELTQIRGLIQ